MQPETATARETLRRIYEDPRILATLLGYPRVSTATHARWIRSPWENRRDDLLLAYRGSYKTTCRVVSVIWGLLFHPETRVWLNRKSDDLAKSTFGEIRGHYERNEKLRTLYAMVGIADPRDPLAWSDDGISLATKRKVTRERNLEYSGIGRAKTGAHYDMILPDDLTSADDRFYANERLRTIRHYSEFKNILNPIGLGGFGIHSSGTLWHADDLNTKLAGSLPTETVTIETPLDPEHATPERIASLKMPPTTNSEFAANYLLKHISEDDRIFDGARFDDVRPSGAVRGYLDPAFTIGGDASALIFGAREKVERSDQYQIVAAHLWQLDIAELYDKIVRAYRAAQCVRLYVEANAAQIAVVHELRRRGLNVNPVHHTKANGNKHFRIRQYAWKAWPDITWDNSLSGSDFLKQLYDYQPDVTHDDAADALAGLIESFNRAVAVQR